MKQYVIDELRLDDYSKLKSFLDEYYAVPSFENLYHLPVDECLLDEVQQSHEGCRPFYFALELSPDKLSCELLIRTSQQIRCQCIQYATAGQRNWLIGWVDETFNRLGIIA
jgi:hypothetical protein